MKKYIVIAVVVTICIIIYAVLPVKTNHKFDRYYEHCDQVEIGMTHEQVLELLGEPETIHYVRRDTITEEYWNYPTSSRASTSNRCRFDSTTQRVIVVYCRDRSRK